VVCYSTAIGRPEFALYFGCILAGQLIVVVYYLIRKGRTEKTN
jgi:hypothetical protein